MDCLFQQPWSNVKRLTSTAVPTIFESTEQRHRYSALQHFNGNLHSTTKEPIDERTDTDFERTASVLDPNEGVLSQ